MLPMISDLAAAWVARGTRSVVKYQTACGVTAEGPTNALLHPIFSVGSAMGNELFFLIFFPCIINGFDLEVSRRTMVCWAAIYYIGQAHKDLWMLPRPPVRAKVPKAYMCAACPARYGGAWCGGRSDSSAKAAAPAPVPAPAPAPAAALPKGVVCLESHYAAEYGMPSTHAMCSVGLPWSLVAWTVASGRFQGDISPLVAFAGFYTFATTLSRPYMGVHSPADLIVGLALGAGILAVDLRVGRAIDEWVLHSPAAPLALPLLLVLLIAVYPRPRTWKSSPGDTILVVASTCGVLLGAAVDCQAHLAAARPGSAFSLPPLPTRFDALALLRLLARIVCAAAACAATRALLKPICVTILSALLGPAYGDEREISAGARVGDTPMHILQGTGVEPPSPAGFGRSSSVQWSGGGAAGGSAGESAPASARASGEAEGGWEGPLGIHKRHAGAEGAASASADASAAGSGESSPAAQQQQQQHPHSHLDPHGKPLRIRAPSGKVLVPPEQRYAIELPTKIVVYGAIGFVTVYIVPRIFVYLGL